MIFGGPTGRFMKIVKLASALIAGVMLSCVSAAGAEAQSAPGDYTFTFTGQCTDCTGYGTATLNVQDYVLGTQLTDANLVEFDYSSNLVTLSIDPSVDPSPLLQDKLSGSISSNQGSYNINVEQDLGSIPFRQFTSSTDGSWSVRAPAPLDVGTDGVWTAVSSAPEPSTWLLMLGGIGGIGLMLRQAKRKTGQRLAGLLAS
jgi:hypothetical protein